MVKCSSDSVAQITIVIRSILCSVLINRTGKGGATIVIGGDNVPPILMSAGDRGYKIIR